MLQDIVTNELGNPFQLTDKQQIIILVKHFFITVLKIMGPLKTAFLQN
jgi:hypothetical protein